MTSPVDLDALVAELTVDAYSVEERLSGLLVGAEEALVPEEPTTGVGVPVDVVTVDCGPDARADLTADVRRRRRHVRGGARRSHARALAARSDPRCRRARIERRSPRPRGPPEGSTKSGSMRRR
jgi:hypothetical protein